MPKPSPNDPEPKLKATQCGNDSIAVVMYFSVARKEVDKPQEGGGRWAEVPYILSVMIVGDNISSGAPLPVTSEHPERDWESREYCGVCQSCGQSYFGPKYRIQIRTCRQCWYNAKLPVVQQETPKKKQETWTTASGEVVVFASAFKMLEKENAELRTALTAEREKSSMLAQALVRFGEQPWTP